MKSSDPSSLPGDLDQTQPGENVNAEAIARARARVRQREQEVMREARANRRYFGQDGDPIFDALFRRNLELPAYVRGAFLILSAVVAVASLLWTWLPSIGYSALRLGDFITGARLLPSAPWLIWSLWGALFGGCLGFWLIAPLYGRRDIRGTLVWGPLALLFFVAAMTLATAY